MTNDQRLTTNDQRLRTPIQTSRQAGVLRYVRVVGLSEGDWQVDVDPVGLSAPVIAAGGEDRLPTPVVGLPKKPAHIPQAVPGRKQPEGAFPEQKVGGGGGVTGRCQRWEIRVKR